METVSRAVSVNQYVSLLCISRCFLEDEPDIASLIGELLGLPLRDDSWCLPDGMDRAKRLLQEAKEQAEALVAKAAAEAAALLARAKAQSNAANSEEKGLETQGNAESSEARTLPEALVVYSDGEEETLPEQARTPAVKRRLSFDSASSSGSKQKSLRSFWGSAEDKAARSAESVPVKATVRNRHSEAYERLRALAREYQDALSDKSEALVRKSFDKGGRPPSSRLASSSSNRRARGQVSTRRELTAYEKLLLCQEAGSRSPEVSEKKHWKQLSEKYGLPVQTLKEYSAKKAVWEALVEKNKLYPKSRASRKAKRTCRFMRQSGGGRKADFPELLPALKQWHATERQHGHSVSKQDFFPEYLTLLVQKGQALLQQAELLPDDDPEKHSLQKLAKLALDRKSKLLASKKYRLSFTERLVKDSGAKFLVAEQVPLWAKAQPKKLLFSEAELSQALPGGGPSLREELKAARTALEETLGEDGPVQVLGGSEEQADSKVKRAHSEADKFRITYEARQKIRGLCGDGTPSAEVSSGLLVFPGKHCRLSNLDSEGRYISTERYREFSEIDITQQPASNMDGVLLNWVVQAQGSEEPCSLYIRDSFAAIFSSEVQQTQQVVNQASVEILGKLTHYLQVTDTDFARSFKSLFREADRATDPLERAEQGNGLRRCLWEWEPNESQSWLSNRYNWLSKDGVPQPPDFKLSSNIKAVSDLIHWIYDSPAPAEDGADDSVDVPDHIQEELLLPLNNSLFLRLSPALRRKHLRLQATSADYKALLDKKALERQNRSVVRRALRSKLLAALSKKLKDRSKKEVLSGIVPRDTTSKAKKVAASTVKDSEKASAKASAKKAPKLSAVSKPSLKTKASLKLKASAAKKKAKKHSKKKAADAVAAKMVSAAAKQAEDEEVDASSWPQPLNSTVRVVSEEAGPLCFGREGDVKGFSDGMHLFSAYGSFSVPASLVQAKNSGWASPRCWKGFNSMSRETLRGILRVTGAKNSGWASPRCWKGFNSMSRETLRGILRVTGALQMPLEEKSFDHVFVKVPSSFDVLLEEQHILGGWELLSWTWPLETKEFALVVSANSDWPHKALEQVLAGKSACSAPSGL
eukprot:s6035_g5.t1